MKNAAYHSKISRLLDERQLRFLATRCLDSDEFDSWFEHAVRVQSRIYGIDQHFEENANVDLVALDGLWESVESALANAPITTFDESYAFLECLRHYEDVEKRIHVGDPIVPGEYGEIVRCKIADVGILRALVWSYSHTGPRVGELEFWRLHDAIGEVVEDVGDVSEDLNTWNFNFWLYSAMSGGSLERGGSHATGLLSRLLREFEDSYAALRWPANSSINLAYRRQVSKSSSVLRGMGARELRRCAPRIRTYGAWDDTTYSEITASLEKADRSPIKLVA